MKREGAKRKKTEPRKRLLEGPAVPRKTKKKKEREKKGGWRLRENKTIPPAANTVLEKNNTKYSK